MRRRGSGRRFAARLIAPKKLLQPHLFCFFGHNPACVFPGQQVSEPVPLRYRAFISYSQADSWARWLHRGLESFPIDKDLAGRETATGIVPPALRPIFRDRDDFAAGKVLAEQTLAALDAAQALIVICSPAAAKSRYVNEEIRRQLG
jgi:hypothetical protein